MSAPQITELAMGTTTREVKQERWQAKLAKVRQGGKRAGRTNSWLKTKETSER